MKKDITALVFRFDPERDKKPYYVEYRLKVEAPLSVLVLLNKIQTELDQTLSFRDYCCGLQMCKSCMVRVNKKKRLACLTIVRPGDSIIIDPVTYPEHHIKDLVVKTDEGRAKD